MTQDELIALGYNRMRREIWADPTDYLHIDMIDGQKGPWAHLWARRTQQIIGAPTPQDILNLEHDPTTDYVPYDGVVDAKDLKP